MPDSGRSPGTAALSLVKFILLHPCTLFLRDGEYISNIRCHCHTRIPQSQAVYTHCRRCHIPIAESGVFVELLVKFLMRGVYISATDVLFATDSAHSRPLQCDLIGHHPASGAVFCVFMCSHREDITRTWVHARHVVHLLRALSPPGSRINIVVVPLYTYEKTHRLVFNMHIPTRIAPRRSPSCSRRPPQTSQNMTLT